MYGLLLVFFSTCILSAYGLVNEIQVDSNSDLGEIQYDVLNSIEFANREEKVSAFERDIPSHTAARVRRQILVLGLSNKVQGVTAKQECDGILLQWDRPKLPFSPNRHTENEEFQHFNIYRSTSDFANVAHMQPYVSGKLDKLLQSPGQNSYKDLYPPFNTELYYAVTMVNGDGQEDKDVDAKKVVFVGSMQKSGQLVKVVPAFLTRLGKVLHHSTAYNPRRNEYLVTYDLDVDNDHLPDQLFALRVDTSGNIVDRKLLNYTANLNKKAGNQGWPTVAYNEKTDEYMIAFQFRSGVMQYFNNKYIVISQRVLSTQTERAAGPGLLIKANGQSGPTDWVDATEPLLKYNSVTGGYVGAVVITGGRKEVVGIFVDSRGKILKSDSICSFKGHAHEPNIFFDSKRKEFYFTCTVESDGIASADFNLQSGVHMVVLTKRTATGEHASNTDTANTKNFVGYTNKTLARTTGYYDELLDRLTLYWEDSDSGKHLLTTASVLLTRARYVRVVTKYGCLATKQVKTPAAVYFPYNNNHFLLWQEKSGVSWAIGGELLQGNLQLVFNREQKNPVLLYNNRLQKAFVLWQEAGVVLARHISIATRPLCSPTCTSQQNCAVQDKCVSNTGDSCATNNGGCSHACVSAGRRKVQCSCPDLVQLEKDGKTCQSVSPCYDMTPIKNPATGRDYFCGRGPGRVVCPANSYCHVAADDGFAKCCPAPLPSYSVLVATKKSIWQLFMDTKQNKATFRKLQINEDPMMLVALGYNPVNKRVYWSDAEANKIHHMSLSGVGGTDTLFWRNIGVVDGLTLDVEDDFIYWTEVSNPMTRGRIERANLDGRNRRTILSGLDKPRAIVLYKPRRLMYWTDWGATPTIQRANLADGGDRKTIVQGELKWPNGLVIDAASRRLFWADAGLDKIETSNLEGRGRRVLLRAPHVHHPYSLGILNNRLFWSDWETSGIHSVDKETGNDVVTVALGLDRPTAFAVFTATPPVDPSIRCTDPRDPANGDRIPSPEEGSDYPQGSVIRYTCFPQFDLHGPVTRTCMSDGSWSDKAPECLTLPRFQTIPSNVTVKETGNALLTCTASTPDTTITWFKDRRVVQGDNYAFMRNGLLILRAYREDKGWYACNATNKAGSTVAYAYVKVLRPLDADCGKPRLGTRGKIVGGKKVEAGSYPWQVSLWNTRANKHFCGGSLVAERWVVTAAHCITGISVSDIEVRLGKIYTNKQERGREQLIRPVGIQIHPHFSSARSDYDWDIALIHLNFSAVYTDYVKPICLPLRKQDADTFLLRPGNIGTITGWGRKRDGGRDTLRRMHQVSVPVVNQLTCKISHRRYVVTENMFCAGHHNGTLGDACQGDSGGPLAIENSLTLSEDDQRWVLAGIISWGDGCGRIGKYGVYTRVSKFARWINDQINKDD